MDLDTARTDPATAFDPYNFRTQPGGLLLHVAWDESARVNNNLLKRAFGDACATAGLGPLSLSLYWLDHKQCLVELYTTLGGERQLSTAWLPISQEIEKKHAEMKMVLQVRAIQKSPCRSVPNVLPTSRVRHVSAFCDLHTPP